MAEGAAEGQYHFSASSTPTGKLNLCVVLCAVHIKVRVLMLFRIVLPSFICFGFGLIFFFLCTAFFPACIHAFYLVSKYTAEFINLLEALHYSRKGLQICFSGLD